MLVIDCCVTYHIRNWTTMYSSHGLCLLGILKATCAVQWGCSQILISWNYSLKAWQGVDAHWPHWLQETIGRRSQFLNRPMCFNKTINFWVVYIHFLLQCFCCSSVFPKYLSFLLICSLCSPKNFTLYFFLKCPLVQFCW